MADSTNSHPRRTLNRPNFAPGTTWLIFGAGGVAFSDGTEAHASDAPCAGSLLMLQAKSKFPMRTAPTKSAYTIVRNILKILTLDESSGQFTAQLDDAGWINQNDDDESSCMSEEFDVDLIVERSDDGKNNNNNSNVVKGQIAGNNTALKLEPSTKCTKFSLAGDDAVLFTRISSEPSFVPRKS